MSLARFAVILAVFLALPGGAAWAASFKVAPVRLVLEPKAKSASLKLLNDGNEPVTVQIDPRKWTQDGTGEDVFEPTEDLVVFPRMATLDPGTEKVIRVGYKGAPDVRERSYRIFAQELPVAAPGEVVVRLALTLGIPVFVKPLKEFASWDIQGAALSEERLRVQVTNGGTSHVAISRLVAVGLDDRGEVFSRDVVGWYALAGTSKRFVISIPREDCLKARSIRVEAATSTTRKGFRLELDPSACEGKAPDAAPHKYIPPG